MQLLRVTIAASLLHAVSCTAYVAARHALSDTPLEKVIQLLNEMTEKGQADMEAEQVQYAAYSESCSLTQGAKNDAIADADSAIDKLDADIEEADSKSTTLGKNIVDLNEDIAGWESEKENATLIRKKEAEHYATTHKDYSESIDAVDRAIQTLKAEDYSRPQALVQLGAQQNYKSAVIAQMATLQKMTLIPKKAKRSLALFFGQGMQAEDPEAYGYAFQSGDVITTLEGLSVEFGDKLRELESEETDRKHAYELHVQALDAQIDGATDDVAAKTESKAKEDRTKAEKTVLRGEAHTVKTADETFLSDFTANCETTADAFEDRQSLRHKEIDDINKALVILNGTVMNYAVTHLPTMVQTLSNTHAALASLRAALYSDTDHQRRAQDFLVDQALKLNSRALATLASQLKEDDPFVKVKELIKNLMARLEAEADQEATQKSYCDDELSRNSKTRANENANINELTAEVETLEALIQKLDFEIADLTKQLADLDADVQNANATRAEESATNSKTITDAKEAQSSVKSAVDILKGFYEDASSATAFVQQEPATQGESAYDSAYTGMRAESTGVVGLLEVVLNDFERLQADTEAAEETAQQEYKKFKHDCEVDMTAKNKDKEYKESALTEARDEDLVQANHELDDSQVTLNNALEYYETLKTSCLHANVSYVDRVGRREEEIESLQEALRILEGETMA